jgi:hypothetical protein
MFIVIRKPSADDLAAVAQKMRSGLPLRLPGKKQSMQFGYSA